MTFLSKKPTNNTQRSSRPPPILTSSAPTTPMPRSIHFTPDTKGSPNLNSPATLPPTPTSPLSRMFRWPTRKSASSTVAQNQFSTPPAKIPQSSVASPGPDILRHVANKDSVSSTCTTNSQSSFFADTYIARASVSAQRDTLPGVFEEDDENLTHANDCSSPLRGKGLPSRQSHISIHQIDPRSDVIMNQNLPQEVPTSVRADNYYYARISSPPQQSKAAPPIKRTTVSRHQRKRSNSFGGIATPAPFDLKASKFGKHAEVDSPSQFTSFPNRTSNRKSALIFGKPPTPVKKTLPVIQRAAAIRDKYLSSKKSPVKQVPPMIVPTLNIVPATPVVEDEEFPARKSQEGKPSLAQQISQRMSSVPAAQPPTVIVEPSKPTHSLTDTETDIILQRQRMANRDSTATVLPVKSYSPNFTPWPASPHNISRDSNATITHVRPILEERTLSYISQTSPTTASDLSNTSTSTDNSTVPSSIFENAQALTTSISTSSISSFESHAFSDASDSDAECVSDVSTPKQQQTVKPNSDLPLTRTSSVASAVSFESELDCEEQLDFLLASLSYGNEISDLASKNVHESSSDVNRELELEIENKLMSNFGIEPLEVRIEQPTVDFGLPQIPSILRERRLSNWFLTKSGSSSSSLSKRAGGYVAYIPAPITPPLTPDASSPDLEAVESLDETSARCMEYEDPSTPKMSKTFSQHMVNSQSIAYTKSLEKSFSSSQLPWLYENSDAESISECTDDGYGCATDDDEGEVATVQTGVRLYSTGTEVGLAL